MLNPWIPVQSCFSLKNTSCSQGGPRRWDFIIRAFDASKLLYKDAFFSLFAASFIHKRVKIRMSHHRKYCCRKSQKQDKCSSVSCCIRGMKNHSWSPGDGWENIKVCSNQDLKQWKFAPKLVHSKWNRHDQMLKEAK